MWKIAFRLTLGLVATIATALAYGSYRWRLATNDLHARLEAGRRPIGPTSYHTSELLGLPAPVQRYFRVALIEGQPMITAVSLQHTGTFNMSLTDTQWKPFTSP
ncbi:MAG: hypothetical protein HGA19_23075, partial [Oscillochloris sp.]|nr:hypothetical protein [Oscillochloris sp.]